MKIDVMMIGLRSLDAHVGGVERHVECLAREYASRGICTEVVVRSRFQTTPSTDQQNKTKIKSLWAPKHTALEAPVHSIIAVLYAAIKRPKILHIHAIGPSIVVPLARVLGLRVVTTHHGEDYNREKWGVIARIILRMGENFQAYFAQERICVSKSLSVRLTEKYKRKFRFVPNAGGDIEKPSSFKGLTKFGLQPGRYIVNVGRFVPEKRQMDLITAFEQLGRVDIKLALVGTADHKSQYSSELIKRATETPGVVLTGFQQGSDLFQLIGGAAVFALPSSHEGMPIAALEAMQLERPLVISDIPPNLDLNLPAECYHITASVDSLTSCLKEMLDQFGNDEIPCRNWSNEMRPFKWPTIADTTIAAYQAASPHFPEVATSSSKQASISAQ